MPVLRGVPSISERRSINRAGTFLRAKGGVGLFFFAYTPDMQYFKRMLPPTFTVPLRLSRSARLTHATPKGFYQDCLGVEDFKHTRHFCSAHAPYDV